MVRHHRGRRPGGHELEHALFKELLQTAEAAFDAAGAVDAALSAVADTRLEAAPAALEAFKLREKELVAVDAAEVPGCEEHCAQMADLFAELRSITDFEERIANPYEMIASKRFPVQFDPEKHTREEVIRLLTSAK